MSLAVPDGGRVGSVVPQSLLTTRDASAIRAFVIERAAMTHMWWSDTLMFDAAVRTCAIGFEVGGDQSQVTRSSGPRFEVRAPMDLGTSWAGMLTDQLHVPRTNGGQTLGDVASFTVDFRDQYYGLVGAVGDGFDGPPLITSGLIEPGRCLWGERSVQFAKQRFAAPRVDLERLSPKLRLWAGRRLVPKILIANQTRVIEAVADPIGEWLPSVPVITCTTHDPTTVLAVLSSSAANDWVRHHAAGSGLSASAIRLSPALLAGIPCDLQA